MRNLTLAVCVFAAVAIGASSRVSAEPLILTLEDGPSGPAQSPEQPQTQSADPLPAPLPPKISDQSPESPSAKGDMRRPVRAPDSMFGQMNFHAKTASTTASPRFTFQRVDSGLLRLDGESGEVVVCSPHKGSWACENIPENRSALEQENARLRAEVEKLRAELAAARSGSPSKHLPTNSEPPANGNDVNFIKGENIARARVVFEHAWHRVVDMILSFQKDMMRKVQSDRAML